MKKFLIDIIIGEDLILLKSLHYIFHLKNPKIR